jgi:hypothetical protein
MYVGGVDCVAYDWLRSSRIDLVERGLVECSVAVDGGYTQTFDAGIVSAEKEGVSILMTQV